MKKKSRIKILAIETSCDDTAVSVLEGTAPSTTKNGALTKHSYVIKSAVGKSQIPLHRKTGGVVPEVAARAHLQNILPVTEMALEQANCTLSDIDYIAVTSGPGLVVSLVVGVEFAKGLSAATAIPLLPTNHMAGHLYSAFHTEDAKIRNKIKFPAIAIVVSGGHTMLLLMKSYHDFRVIGHTMDDAVGEAFDKVARLLGLPYPGGPEISKLALEGSASVPFPRPMLKENNFNFSFSGLKTAVLYHIQKLNGGKDPHAAKLTRVQKADIAASFEEAAIDVLVQKAMRAAKKYKCKTIALAGGVAANKALRQRLADVCAENKMTFTMPPFQYCMDNGAMIAMAAYYDLLKGKKPVKPERVKADPSWELK